MSSTRIDTLVRIETGLVRGLDRGDHAAFLGVPYAAPPVGELRFRAPAPVTGWDGVRDATAYGPTPQRRPFGDVTTIPEPSIPGDDTLSVNVFTPAAGEEDAALPVFVWVHGGGYFAGSAASPWYDGAAFARQGIVTVTLSYRLGFDGFGWIEDAPLNRGVRDQIAALEWVQRNIRAFGGDPARVTVAGQSAGGGSVLTLLTSPAARGLFRAVVSHSGAPGHLTEPVAAEIGRRFAADRGIPPTVAGWRSLGEDEILDHERRFNHAPGGLVPGRAPAEALSGIGADPLASGLGFAPLVDGEVVVAVADALARGEAADIPLLLGATRNEFAFPTPVTAPEIAEALRDAGVADADAAGFFAEIGRVGDRYAGSQLAVLSMFRAPAVHLARRRASSAGVRTWLYDFAYRSPLDGLSAHCYDLPFAWGLPDAEGVSRVLGEPPHPLVTRMHAEWAAFIRTAEASWAPVAEARAGALVFDAASAYASEAYRFEHAVLDALT
ncbi:carboxylesterase/lipase family protein [Microbacterium sp. SORGH_AS_0888]|uniref:carboxylesterase/lipase family protein n=1 Tax=Microbacterium sp. SORGH_AS_0888 TaxID=3041791 RepID=UPI00278B155F|nr:carboxylesterase family protein [Microbacterium sp. SORGH_AS_0888]MDQ1129466.1 para-nitrobenzyl esterase [Microbacterium sp. SORGH_AS_0888]